MARAVFAPAAALKGMNFRMRIAVMGYGIVGSGVVELFEKNHESILGKSTQAELDIKYILDLRVFPESPYGEKHIKDFNLILNDPEVGIVVETMGGLRPAFEFVSACLQAGKSVVTSNKELVAEKGYELLKLANEKNVNFLFEASVGGGIPIIRPITQCLAANEIKEIAGILNGTTNFILTKMITEKMSFEDALKLAQDNGYAEKDPTADVEGADACRKICILATLCFGKHVYPSEVATEGITAIASEDVEYAANWGGVVKLIASAKRVNDNQISAIVSPAFVESHSQFAGVDDVFNAILVRGDAIGDVVFYGRGAGKMPTASAVVADVIDCAKHTVRNKMMGWSDSSPDYVVNHLDCEAVLYVRGFSKNVDLSLREAEAVLGDIKVLYRKNQPETELAFITPSGMERELRDKLLSIDSIVPVSVIRVTDY